MCMMHHRSDLLNRISGLGKPPGLIDLLLLLLYR